MMTTLLSGRSYPTIGYCHIVLNTLRSFLHSADASIDNECTQSKNRRRSLNESMTFEQKVLRFLSEQFSYYFDEKLSEEQKNKILVSGTL